MTERAALLELIRKMTRATEADAATPAGAEGMEEVEAREDAVSPAVT
jgi:hypothetical protein